MYRFRGEDGADLFLKVVPQSHAGRQLDADVLAQFVAGREVRASCLLAGFPRALDDQWALCAYPFVAGRHPLADVAEMRRLGAEIARLHEALAGWPDQAGVQLRAEERRAMLDRRLRAVAAGAATGGPDPRRVKVLCADNRRTFADSPSEARLIHGDLNPGNVLVEATGAVVFLDFEEAVGAWLPAAVDLALPIERLVLCRIADDGLARDAAIALIEGYASRGGRAPAARGWLADTLRMLALRSFALLAEAEAVGQCWPDSEWRKFLDLVDLHAARSGLIAAVEGDCAPAATGT